MKRIYVTGDIHNKIDIDKLNSANFPKGKTLDKSDFVIVCGDFGLVWSNDKEDLYWQQWLINKPWTTLFVDGNHENFDILGRYPVVNMFGGNVSKINNSIFWLRRGNVYDLHGYKFFTFGGANSIDKTSRIAGVSWWEQEIPSTAEMETGLKTLDSVNWNVDYIITHTAPKTVIEDMLLKRQWSHYKESDLSDMGLRKYFDKINNHAVFTHWYFGHFHIDIEDEKHTAIYEKITRIM